MMEVDALLCVRKGDANMLCRICDDERSELEAILNIVSDYAGEHPGLCLAAQCFSNPSDMLDEMDRNGAPDVAPLDICMPGVLGTEVARESRRLYADGALQPLGAAYASGSGNDAPAATTIALRVQKATGNVTITSDISKAYDGSVVANVACQALSTGAVTPGSRLTAKSSARSSTRRIPAAQG